jgi:hypothetical protein
VLLHAAARGPREVTEAAASSLARLTGKNVDRLLLDALDRGESKTRRVVVEVLGRRACTAATKTLIAHARGTEPSIRLAVIKALGETATAANVQELVDLLVRANASGETAAAEAALAAVHARTDDKDAFVAAIAARTSQGEAAARAAIFRVLGRVGGNQALAAVRAAIGDSNPALQDAAIRALCEWPGAEPADDLLAIARRSASEKHRVLALRGYLRMAALEELPAPRRLAMARQAIRLAQRDEERRLALGVLAGVPSPEALAEVLPMLDSESLKEEAGVAAVAIGERTLPNHPAAVVEAMRSVLRSVKNQDVIRRARELQTKARNVRS